MKTFKELASEAVEYYKDFSTGEIPENELEENEVEIYYLADDKGYPYSNEFYATEKEVLKELNQLHMTYVNERV